MSSSRLCAPGGVLHSPSFRELERPGSRSSPCHSSFEHETVASREAERLGLPDYTVEAIIKAFCVAGRETSVRFRIRPFLRDPGDEFLLELAVAGGAHATVTHNVRHFAGTEQFGVPVLTPREFLRKMEEEKS